MICATESFEMNTSARPKRLTVALIVGLVLTALWSGAYFALPANAASPAFICDDSLKAKFRPDSQTKVTLVKFFHKSDELTVGKPAKSRALNDVCLVKLVIGPGNPGPAGAPST